MAISHAADTNQWGELALQMRALNRETCAAFTGIMLSYATFVWGDRFPCDLVKKVKRVRIAVGREFYTDRKIASFSALTDLFFDPGTYYDGPLKRLPTTITYLRLGNHFNTPINDLPDSLRTLVVGDLFDQPLDQLPAQLNKLVLGRDFDQPVDLLPVHLDFLSTGYRFNQHVENLPETLTYLRFGKHSTGSSRFNHRLDRLPSSLTTLITGNSFNFPLDFLPAGLDYLSVGDAFAGNLNHLPENLTFLKTGTYFNSVFEELPLSIQCLVLGCSYDQDVSSLFAKEVQFCSPSRKTVRFRGYPVDYVLEPLHRYTLIYDEADRFVSITKKACYECMKELQ
jgi:hypothetical protein